MTRSRTSALAKTSLLAAALAGALATAVPAAAQPAGGGWQGGGWHGGGGGMHILRGLGLSDAQKAQVQQLVQASRAQTKPIAQQLRALHGQLATAVLTAGTTAADLQPLVQQETQLRYQLETARYALFLQIRNVLTPAQLSQAAAIQQRLAALHDAERNVTGRQ